MSRPTVIRHLHPGQQFRDDTRETGARWIPVKDSQRCPGDRTKWHINGTDCWEANYPVIVR